MSELRLGEVERLAFAKYLAAIGRGQLDAPEPASAAGLLSLHDAVELFLQTAADHARVQIDRRIHFLEYWTKFRAREIELPYFVPMQRLNDLRVALKHHGVIPRRAELSDLGHVVQLFLDETTQLVFQRALNSVSFADLVLSGAARAELKRAEDALGKNDYPNCVKQCAGAMDTLIEEYESSKRTISKDSPFQAGGRKIFTFHHGRLKHRLSVPSEPHWAELGRLIDEELAEVWQTLEALQDATRVLFLGLDYRKWARFNSLTPMVIHTYSDRTITESGVPAGYTISRDDAEFCIQFVVDAALRFREFDFRSIERFPFGFERP